MVISDFKVFIVFVALGLPRGGWTHVILHHHFWAIIHCFVNLPQPTSTQDLLGCYCSDCELVSSSLDTPVER